MTNTTKETNKLLAKKDNETKQAKVTYSSEISDTTNDLLKIEDEKQRLSELQSFDYEQIEEIAKDIDILAKQKLVAQTKVKTKDNYNSKRYAIRTKRTRQFLQVFAPKLYNQLCTLSHNEMIKFYEDKAKSE